MVPLLTVSDRQSTRLNFIQQISVYLVLLLKITWFVPAVLLIFRSEAVVLPIAKVRLLLALLSILSDSTAVPLIYVLSLHDALPIFTLALTLPAPIRLALALRTMFAVSVIAALPPSS